MNHSLFSIVSSDISEIKSRSGVSQLFRKLGYDVEDDLRMPFSVLELPGRLKDFIQDDGRAIYLFCNYDHLFQIYLFETNNLNLTPIKNICQSFSKKQGDYLFLFTRDYTEIVFVNPRIRPGGLELRRLRLNTLQGAFHTDLQVLNSLALPRGDMDPFEIHDLQCEAFQKERVTDDFYKTYKKVFEDVRQSLGEVRSDAQAHAFAQILMNRLMLLYFVQKREWLNNSPDFLRELYNTCRQDEREDKSFYRDYLEPLFFRAFNRENGFEDLTVPDPVKEIFKNAPYLNGGMFARLEEIEAPGIKVPDEAFELMFDQLFERYNFTVREDTPLDIELAIDPELLGNVYQRLVSEEERGKAGLFYTRATEVNFMCRRALIEYLARHLPQKRREIIRLIMNYLDPPDNLDLPWDKVEEYLAGVKICDPACGSGAFLVAMLHLLVELRAFVRKKLNQDTDSFNLKKEIISQNLYGADVKAHAVRIAELRLWLSLVVDAPDDFVRKHPDDPILPNLTYRLRQGDSLIEEFAGVPLYLRGELEITGKRTPQIIRKIFDIEQRVFHGRVKSSDLGKVRHEHRKLEQELFQGILKDRMESIRAKIRTHKIKLTKPPDKHKQKGLFGEKPEQIQIDFDKDFRRETEKKIADLEDKLAEYKRLLESKDFGKLSERDYVLWEIDFADVFTSKGGFDIIIGNPPYVRQEEIGPPTVVDRPTTREERKAYKERLIRSVQACLGKQVRIDKKSDLYVYFYYLGISLLNQNGVFVFITSNSWLDVGYGAGLQEWLLNNMEVVDIYDNQAQRSFKSADVNTVIVVFNKPKKDPLAHTARFTAFKKPFEEVLSSDTLLAIEDAKGIVSTDDFRVYQATQQDLLVEGFEKDKKQKTIGTAAPLVGKYKGNKWGGKYLRAPDIYFKILEKAGDKLVRLGDIAEVRFGIKTGADNFFYLKQDEAIRLGIESEYQYPILVSSDQINGYLTKKENTDMVLISTPKSKDEIKGSGLLNYIRRGELEPFHGRGGATIPANRPTCRSHRPYWYSISIPPIPEIYWMEMRRERYFVLFNQARLSADHTFYAIYPKGDIDSTSLCGLLNSTIIPLFVEVFANDPGGGGSSLQTPTGEIKRFVWVPKSLIGSPDIKKAFERICKRECFSILKEVSLPDRRQLDSIVFDALGISKNEQDAVYEAVVKLVENRLEKARSLKQSSEIGSMK